MVGGVGMMAVGGSGKIYIFLFFALHYFLKGLFRIRVFFSLHNHFTRIYTAETRLDDIDLQY